MDYVNTNNQNNNRVKEALNYNYGQTPQESSLGETPFLDPKSAGSDTQFLLSEKNQANSSNSFQDNWGYLYKAKKGESDLTESNQSSGGNMSRLMSEGGGQNKKSNAGMSPEENYNYDF